MVGVKELLKIYFNALGIGFCDIDEITKDIQEIYSAAHKDNIEFLSEQVHNTWWEEKKRQGFHAPYKCPNIEEPWKIEEYKFHKWCPKCHTDMYPYNELPEHVKEYDRVTARSVLAAIEKMEG